MPENYGRKNYQNKVQYYYSFFRDFPNILRDWELEYVDLGISVAIFVSFALFVIMMLKKLVCLSDLIFFQSVKWLTSSSLVYVICFLKVSVTQTIHHDLDLFSILTFSRNILEIQYFFKRFIDR